MSQLLESICLTDSLIRSSSCLRLRVLAIDGDTYLISFGSQSVREERDSNTHRYVQDDISEPFDPDSDVD